MKIDKVIVFDDTESSKGIFRTFFLNINSDLRFCSSSSIIHN